MAADDWLMSLGFAIDEANGLPRYQIG
ncbi:hypothetical protein CCACVL1_18146 [Corchorus capsularis]|uniref:Uncharacterized protein n=1 Tax=Corchorus capsularis TaxID=210143 RepID=A0A1R3HMD6_COCAP|nr:hypothetical protein CCACVL1_18146 [Corchorus capsularis]